MTNDDLKTQCGPSDRLNERCFCISLDRSTLAENLAARLRASGAADVVDVALSRFFADVPVFVQRAHIEEMQQVVEAIDQVSRLPDYAEAVLEWAPPIAQYSPGPIGAFMGFDFHLSDSGAQLIEINTNAGGAFINNELARAQRTCCDEAQYSLRSKQEIDGFDHAVMEMFRSEWSRQRGSEAPAVIAIVDDEPERQFMYPEFRLAQNLLAANGIESMITDPRDLSLERGELLAGGKRIDLVYNRLVDFAFGAIEHEALGAAYLQGSVVVTPSPRTHALLADKRNLTLLSDVDALRALGVSEQVIQIIQRAIPRTQVVTRANADELWRSRRELFFKPATGHGSKGVYRGESMTRGKFAKIVEDGYVAQRYVPPTRRMIKVDGKDVALKIDVRLYAYGGRTLLSAARIYSGQATNFRTPGGGFAPVFQT